VNPWLLLESLINICWNNENDATRENNETDGNNDLPKECFFCSTAEDLQLYPDIKGYFP
jgi:hypothetical protein